MKNYDKQLAKYARQLDNPTYYCKILRILDKAERSNYQWKQFNVYDLEKITSEILAYSKAITTDEEHKMMVKHCNCNWFIISDKNFILWESESLSTALSTYIRIYMLLWYSKITQLFFTDRLITTENVNKKIYLVRGAIHAAKMLNCDLWDLEDKWIKN